MNCTGVFAMLSQYLWILLTIAVAGALVGGMLLANALFGPKRDSEVKRQPFECGTDQLTSPRQRFSIKYYVIAIAFIVFDIEVVFLYPWAVIYRSTPGMMGLLFVEMLIFVAILMLGLLYMYKRKALKWE